MIKSLELIKNTNKKKDIPLDEVWLKFLKYTDQKTYNLRNVEDLTKISNRSVLSYVTRTLECLERNTQNGNFSSDEIQYVEDTLKWSEVAKCGNKTTRGKWIKKGYDLYIHNLASAEIYKETVENSDFITYTLIKTHGLIGQYVKGEVNIINNKPLTDLIKNNLISSNKLKKILILLNMCIIEAVSDKLYLNVKDEVNATINIIIEDNYIEEDYSNKNYIIDRMKKIFKTKSLEEFAILEGLLNNQKVRDSFGMLFEKYELWFVDSGIEHFSMEEIVKILLMVVNNAKEENVMHVNFESIMNDMYYMYNGVKVKNLYKLRIIESYLEAITIEDVLTNNIKMNEHLGFRFKTIFNTLRVKFKFSIQAQKLIEFCEVAYGSNEIYNQAVFMLYDLFGFRRDAYDRFYNEMSYLSTMNSTINYKAIILDYITGKTVLDVGPGGGALLDLIEKSGKVERVIGIDISQNVIEELKRKKNEENKKWEIVKGDALNLKNHFKKNEIDTIIFCSVIHELFSYIEMEGKKFNHKTVELAMKSCFDVLPKGGRIIIRDGIMSETNKNRIIRFKNKDDIRFLNKYCKDFKGRTIKFKLKDDRTVQMKENDAMEFLYTYTWGEESYAMEVQEQFGYYTPSEYIEMLQKAGNCKVIECKHYLQEGYEENLLKKIEYYDINWQKTSLPDSTCIIVVEKL